MAQFEFHLNDRSAREQVEVVLASDEFEARTLAEMRLLLSRDYTRISVLQRGRKRFELTRDSLRRPTGLRQD